MKSLRNITLLLVLTGVMAACTPREVLEPRLLPALEASGQVDSLLTLMTALGVDEGAIPYAEFTLFAPNDATMDAYALGILEGMILDFGVYEEGALDPASDTWLVGNNGAPLLGSFFGDLSGTDQYFNGLVYVVQNFASFYTETILYNQAVGIVQLNGNGAGITTTDLVFDVLTRTLQQFVLAHVVPVKNLTTTISDFYVEIGDFSAPCPFRETWVENIAGPSAALYFEGVDCGNVGSPADTLMIMAIQFGSAAPLALNGNPLAPVALTDRQLTRSGVIWVFSATDVDVDFSMEPTGVVNNGP